MQRSDNSEQVASTSPCRRLGKSGPFVLRPSFGRAGELRPRFSPLEEDTMSKAKWPLSAAAVALATAQRHTEVLDLLKP